MAENKQYEVLKGIDYPPGRRVEATDPPTVVDDIPAMSIGWLLEQGVIREYVEQAPSDNQGKDDRITKSLSEK
ncbi:MAG: hypothetical protein WBV94_25235 [Blastocatellia bacterium]